MDSPLRSDPLDVPPEHALLVVDMKSYSQIPERRMAPVRADLDDILATVLAQSDLPAPRSTDSAYKDTGDGAILVLPARHTARLVDPLLGHLGRALERYDRTRLASAPPLRLRASVHTGPLTLPDHRGHAINDACRLVNCVAVRQAMAAALANDSFLAAVVSDTAFRRSVLADRTDVRERQFVRTVARVTDKPGFEETCWIFVPGLAPSVIDPYLGPQDGRPPQPPQDDATAAPGRADQHDATERPAGVKQKGSASGKAHLVQVGGNYITGPERS